jgi:hypothetical protein
MIEMNDKRLELFVEPPKAIYKVNGYTPVLLPNVIYYTSGNYREFYFDYINSVDEIDKLNLDPLQDITDKHFNVLVPHKLILFKDKLLTTDPVINPHIVDSLLIIFNEYINRNLIYCNTLYSSQSNIHEHLLPEGMNLYTDGTLEDLCDPVLSEVYEFINKHPWNIYFVDLVGYDLFIKRGIDYRIYDWTKNHGKYNK